MNERESHEQPREIDLSKDFLDLSDSAFAERLQRAGEAKVLIRIPISALGANVFQARLQRLLATQPEKVAVTIEARRQEKDLYEDKFKGVNWEVTD